MSDNSVSESSSSFDPMRSRVKEFVYYRKQKEIREKEKEEHKNNPRLADYTAGTKNAQNSKKNPGDDLDRKMNQGNLDSFSS